MSSPKNNKKHCVEGPIVTSVLTYSLVGYNKKNHFELVGDNPEDELVEEMELYISAHRLIPKAYVFNGSASSSLMVDKATFELFRRDIHYLVRLSAIVTLGHSPCKRAIDALESFIATDHPLAQVASLALSECLSLFTKPHRGVVPELFHIG